MLTCSALIFSGPTERLPCRLFPDPSFSPFHPCPFVSAHSSLESGHGPSGDSLLPLPAQFLYSGQGKQGDGAGDLSGQVGG